MIYGCNEDPQNNNPISDPCKNIPCINGAFQQDTSFCLCVCEEGFFGNDCANEDKCVTGNVTCLNGAVCDQLTGICDCPNGFEGDSCQINSNLRYEGLYNVVETCSSSGGDNLITYVSSINADTSVAGRITFSNINNRGLQLKANVNDNFISIPAQPIPPLQVTGGSGQINQSTLTINIKYSYTESGVTSSCDAIFTKQ